MNRLFIIPQLNKSVIAQINNINIQEINQIDIPFNSKSVITENNLIIALCFDLKALRIFDINGMLIDEKLNFNYKSIACEKNIVYFGGEFNIVNLGVEYNNESLIFGETFSLIDFEISNFYLIEIDLPIDLIQGKSIDDILINGNQLVLVDNVQFPKYMIMYDISTPNNPVHTRTDELPNNGTYEHIIKGDINNNWMVLFSSSYGERGSSQYISISGKKEGRLSVYRSRRQEDSGILSLIFNDICLIDNNLFILLNDDLGYIDLNEEISISKFKKIPTKQTDLKRIFKSPDNSLIVISENEFERVELNNYLLML